MTSTLTAISFLSPSLELVPNPRPSLLQRQQEITCKWRTPLRNRKLSLKPLQAALGPGTTGDGPNRKAAAVPSSPVLNVIQEFYASLNDKADKRLKKLIAPDCVIEDTTYYEPLDAKNIHTFFKRLREAMGKHVRFVIDEVSEGVEATTAVMWHLEWNGNIIPFTKGCSFYICSGYGDRLLIKKVHIFVESPVKPGNMALEILTIVINLFDRFPKLAEAFLKKPEAIVQPFINIYKFFVEPVVLILLAYYIHFWTYVAQGLTMVFNILYSIFKLFM